jgi:hypothetical protein
MMSTYSLKVILRRRGDRFRELQNPTEYQRLVHTTLMSVFGQPHDNNNNN